MAWFKVYAEIEMEIEARDEDAALFKARTIIDKRVVGQSFGYSRNDRGEVTKNYHISEIVDDEPEDRRNFDPAFIKGESWSRE